MRKESKYKRYKDLSREDIKSIKLAVLGVPPYMKGMSRDMAAKEHGTTVTVVNMAMSCNFV